MERMDFAKREARRLWSQAKYFLMHGGWKTWLRWKVAFKIECRVMRAFGYQYRHVGLDTYRWQRKDTRA
jgi:hypothetical protein